MTRLLYYILFVVGFFSRFVRGYTLYLCIYICINLVAALTKHSCIRDKSSARQQLTPANNKNSNVPIHTCIYTIHSYMHACMHTYIYTYILKRTYIIPNQSHACIYNII